MRKPVPFRCPDHVWTDRIGDFSVKLECLLPIHHDPEERHWKIADDRGTTIEVRWEKSSEVFEPLGDGPTPVDYSDLGGPPPGTSIPKGGSTPR